MAPWERIQPTCQYAGDMGLIPGLGRNPGEGNGNPPQDSCLGNPMDRGAWWAMVHEVAKESDTDSLPAEPPGKPNNTGVGGLSLLQGIFPTPELNWGLLHCRQILYQLSNEESPTTTTGTLKPNLPQGWVRDGSREQLKWKLFPSMPQGWGAEFQGAEILVQNFLLFSPTIWPQSRRGFKGSESPSPPPGPLADTT